MGMYSSLTRQNPRPQNSSFTHFFNVFFIHSVVCLPLASAISLAKIASMAAVLCTGVDKGLLKSRQLILEYAGHIVIPALGENELIAACTTHRFDVAVIGQIVSKFEKQRILQLIRKHCPNAKALELFVPSTGKMLPEADDWLEVPARIPFDLAERVSALAERRDKASGVQKENQR